MFTVVITEKGGNQRRVECEESEVTIGRVQGNDVVLPKGNVSKRHSRIVLRDNRFIVVDLKSTNGTYVNGRKITSPLVVKEGDKIYIGDFILTLESQAEAPLGMPSKAPESMRPPSALPPVLGGGEEETSASGPARQPPAGARPSSGPAGLPSAPPASSSGANRGVDMGPLMGRLERNLESRPPGLPARPTVAAASHDDAPASFDASILGDLGFLGAFAELLYDGSVQRIEITRHDRVRVDRGRGLQEEKGVGFAGPTLLDAALRRLAQGAALDEPRAGSASFELVDGTHVSALWPPLSSPGPTAVFTRRPQTVRSLAELQNAGMLDGAQAQQLRSALTARENVLVVGPRRANTTAVANALLSQLEVGARVVAIEHGAELGPRERVHLGLRWPREGLAEVLQHADAFEADRWVLHGLPAVHSALLLPTLAARADGSICTLRAPSVRDALEDLRAHAGTLGDRAEGLLTTAFPVVVEVGLKSQQTRVQSVARLRMQGGRASAA